MIKPPMPQVMADELGGLILSDIEIDESITTVTESALEKTGVPRNESGVIQMMQQRDKVLIGSAK